MRTGYTRMAGFAVCCVLIGGCGSPDTVSGSEAAIDDAWIANFSQAQEIARQKGLPMLLNFTGSDWCGWCIKLKGEVFSKPEFKTTFGKV